MPTNEERREVAARLRNYENLRESFRESPICAFIDALGVEYIDWKGVCNRLADLIEPEPDITCEFDSQVCGKIRCKRCGAFVSVDSVWDCFGCIPVRYCPNCGSKVIRNAD